MQLPVCLFKPVPVRSSGPQGQPTPWKPPGGDSYVTNYEYSE